MGTGKAPDMLTSSTVHDPTILTTTVNDITLTPELAPHVAVKKGGAKVRLCLRHQQSYWLPGHGHVRDAR